jgi:hypothetical protein
MLAVEVDHIFSDCMFGEVFPEHMSPGGFMHLNVCFDRFLAFSGTVAPPTCDTPRTGLSPPGIRQGVERKAATHSPSLQPNPEFLSLSTSWKAREMEFSVKAAVLIPAFCVSCKHSRRADDHSQCYNSDLVRWCYSALPIVYACMPASPEPVDRRAPARSLPFWRGRS